MKSHVSAIGNRLHCAKCGLSRCLGDGVLITDSARLADGGHSAWLTIFLAEHAHGGSRPSLRHLVRSIEQRRAP
jgi:hypothetical protein